MSEADQIRVLRTALKSALHRLEMEAQSLRDRGRNNNPRDKVICECYAALRASEPPSTPTSFNLYRWWLERENAGHTPG